MPPQDLSMEYTSHFAPPVPPHMPKPLPTDGCQERNLKCVLLGDGAVGKTSLLVSYTTNGYPTRYIPTAFDDFSALVQVDNTPVKLQLCDTAGQDEFDKLRHFCYPKTDVVILCFSVVSPSSFQNISEKWISEIQCHCPNVPVVLVGTQCDLREDVKISIQLARYREKPIPQSSGKALAEKIGAVGYVECSALTQKNLKDVFDLAILSGLRYSDLRNQRERKVAATASKMKTLSKAWWKKYVCV
ncbi:PREDICTED: rho-related GTP-binding protein RhoU-like [Nanorana parkeri]|uniref:rho-related GTP-binding protein RhoU-like n=1 Tax=Nanorana parkeri TaxID=125878 RepID=UPI00085423C6|nr:PREDICTED: rho-related GTP-binding protein RhoU-like [Nanorana parkeri]